MSDRTRCPECGVDLTPVGAVRYEETYTGTRITAYSANISEGGTLVTTATVCVDDTAGILDSTIALCDACGTELDAFDDVSYEH